MSRVNNRRLRKEIFNRLDTNGNGKIDKNEVNSSTQIFGLKEGDRKIKSKNFNNELGIIFSENQYSNNKVKHQETVEGTEIDTCYHCKIVEKDTGIDIRGKNNTAIGQYGNNLHTEILNEDIIISNPVNENASDNTIGLCVECTAVYYTGEDTLDGPNNTIVYQDNSGTHIIKSNEEGNIYEDKIGKPRDEKDIHECIDCTYEKVNDHTFIDGENSNVIKQEDGNNNHAYIKKDSQGGIE